MEIFFFFRKIVQNGESIEEGFKPFVEELKKNNIVKVFHVPYYGANPIHMLCNMWYVYKHSTKEGINHITGDIHYTELGLILRKSILTIHDDYTCKNIKNPVKKWLAWLLWIFFPIKIANYTVCISPSTLNNIKRLYNSPKLCVITHHAPSPLLKPIKSRFNKECPRFLQIGTEPHKNLESSLKALRGIKCKLVVLKKMSSEQVELAKSLGLNFENKYNLPYEDVAKEYEKCDIVLFPTLLEGLGLPIIEAQASGKPIITTNRSPMNWVAGNGAEYLEDPLDIDEYRRKILHLVEDDGYRTQLIEKALENCKRYNPESVIQEYMKLYSLC